MTTTNNTLTAIDGLHVGHHTDLQHGTGCTVILCPPQTVGGVDQRGGAPGTRETDLLRPLHQVTHVNALVLSGGSAFGLGAADGVMRYLYLRGEGFMTGSGVAVPIVPAAILYDLELLGFHFPTPTDAYRAARSASAAPVPEGTVGAGTGCRVGALAGNAQASKGGLGSASRTLPNGLKVAALMVVNAVGDVIDADGRILAGLRDPHSGEFIGTLNALIALAQAPPPSSNTVIGGVATNAQLTKEGANKVAQMAQDGLARAISPAHTMYDGDTIFSLATGKIPADVSIVGALAAELTAEAIRRAVRTATRLGDVVAAHG